MYLDFCWFTHPLPFTENKALTSHSVFVSNIVKYGKLHTYMISKFVFCHLETYTEYFLLMHGTTHVRSTIYPCLHRQQRLQGCVKKDALGSDLSGKKLTAVSAERTI